jgi:nucleoside-diphosphate-sugar epimerase
MQHLVIGGTGFIGGHLVEHLIERGGQVRVLARREERPAWLPARADLTAADWCDVDSIAAEARGADLVYLTAPLPDAAHDEATAITSVTRTLTGLIGACQRARVSRLAFLSSVDVYGPALPSRPVTEEQAPAPATRAGRLRLAAEAVLREAAGRLPVVILRPVTVFGPRDDHFTRPLLDTYATGDGPSLASGGRARLSLVYVKDVARALALVARHPQAVGETFNVSGCSTTWRALVATLCAELDVPTPRPGPPYLLARLIESFGIAGPSALPAALVGRTRVYSDGRLARRLNYHPAYDLLEAIHETVVWHRRVTRFAAAPSISQPAAIRVLS